MGPVSARYKGTVRFERLDQEEGVAEIAAAGQDVRGKGGADMRMTSRIIERGPAETEVTVTSTVNVTGILAQFGRGMIQDLSDQMFRQFTDAMRAALESAADRPAADRPGAESPGGDAIDAVSLGAKVGGRALGRAVRRPGFWLTAVIVAAAILWLLYSRLS